MSIQQRVPQICSKTIAWYQNVFKANPTWSCTKTTQDLNNENKNPTMFCLEGGVYIPHRNSRTERVHVGVLYIPDKPADQAKFLKHIADLETCHNLCIHMIATPVFPFFLDFDCVLDDTDSSFRLINKVIQHVGLDLQNENVDAMLQHLKLPRKGNLPVTLTIHFNADEDITLDKIIDIVSKENVLLADGIREMIGAIFIMAISMIVHSVVMSFYPEDAIPKGNSNIIVLGTHMRGSTTEHTFKIPSKDNGKFKYGSHMHMPGVFVDRDKAKFIWQALFEKFIQLFPDGFSNISAETFWSDAFDSAPYNSRSGGLRLPYCYKAIKCVKCSGSRCQKCNYKGKIVQNLYYGPLCCVGGDLLMCRKRMEKMFRSSIFVLMMCNMRLTDKGKLTPGFTSEGRNYPKARLHDIFTEYSDEFTSTGARKRFNQLKKEHGINSELDHTDEGIKLQTIAAATRVMDYIPGSKISKKNRVFLVPGDPRFVAVKGFFKDFVISNFGSVYKDLYIHAVCLILDSTGTPSRVYVFPRGPSAQFCMNRVADLMDDNVWKYARATIQPSIEEKIKNQIIMNAGLDSSLRGQNRKSAIIKLLHENADRIKLETSKELSMFRKSHTDVDGIPGRHTSWSNCIYFSIDQQGSGGVTQKCNNSKAKTTRRSSQKIGSNVATDCRNKWEGKRIACDSQLKQVIRNCFYLPDEQEKIAQREHIMSITNTLSKKLNTIRDIVGPTDLWRDDIDAVNMNGEKKSKRSKGMKRISMRTFGDDDGGDGYCGY